MDYSIQKMVTTRVWKDKRKGGCSTNAWSQHPRNVNTESEEGQHKGGYDGQYIWGEKKSTQKDGGGKT